MARRFLMLCVLLLAAGVAGAQAPAAVPVWLVLGDSLSAAHGIPKTQGWVVLLQQRLSERGYRARVVNASVSGETTSGGLARLPALLMQHQPAVVLVELGANDGLRALPVTKLRDNLAQIATLVKKAGARPAIFEMLLPPNYGAGYVEPFKTSFALVARQQGAALVPFLLAPIAADPSAFQDDGIHPTAAAQPKILDAVWPQLEALARH